MATNDHTRRAFEKAYDEYADALFRYAFFRVSNREQATDLVQETYTKVWQYAVAGNTIDNWKPLLFKSMSNLVIDYYRKKKSASLEMLEEAGMPEVADEAGTIEKEAEIRVVLKAVEELDETYRQVILLRFVSDLTPKEIAEIIGENENAVSVRIHRALRKVKDTLHIDHE